MSPSDKKILLVYPGTYGEFKPFMPLSLLYLASILRLNGYECEVFDMRLQELGKCDLSGTLCVGISTMTGPMVGDALRFAESVRAYDKSIPIIWGGVHPSLLAEQTARSSLVDIVVRGEGEETLLELVRRLDSGEPFDDVMGLTYQESGEIISTPDRPFLDMNDLPIDLPYDLFMIGKYELDYFPVHTSRGCPGKCSFCYNIGFNRGSYRYKSAERVLEEVDLVLERFQVDKLSFGHEDNFFTSRKRVEQICKGLVELDREIEWVACCRFDTLDRYGDDFIDLLEESGCSELVFGGESGSQAVLDGVLDKGITVEQMLAVTTKLAKTKIGEAVFFMNGIPAETDDDLDLTMSLIDRMAEINPELNIIGFQIFVPYPATRLSDKVEREYAYSMPERLEDWARYALFRDVEPTWLSKQKTRELKGITTMAHFAFCEQKSEVPERFNTFPYSLVFTALTRSARWRWKHRFFKYPLEWDVVEWFVSRNRGWI